MSRVLLIAILLTMAITSKAECISHHKQEVIADKSRNVDVVERIFDISASPGNVEELPSIIFTPKPESKDNIINTLGSVASLINILGGSAFTFNKDGEPFSKISMNFDTTTGVFTLIPQNIVAEAGYYELIVKKAVIDKIVPQYSCDLDGDIVLAYTIKPSSKPVGPFSSDDLSVVNRYYNIDPMPGEVIALSQIVFTPVEDKFEEIHNLLVKNASEIDKITSLVEIALKLKRGETDYSSVKLSVDIDNAILRFVFNTPATEPDIYSLSIPKAAIDLIVPGNKLDESSLFLEVKYIVTGTKFELGYNYDGRYVKVEAGPGWTIRYTLNDSSPIDSNLSLYENGTIDLKGLNTLRAVAVREGFDNSSELLFTPSYYADTSNIFTSCPGLISEYRDNIFSHVTNGDALWLHGSLYDGSPNIDSSDYNIIKELLSPELRHLDMSDVIDEVIPVDALNIEGLRSVVLPASLSSVGKQVFGKDICAIEWVKSGNAPSDLFNGIDNPNLLVFTERKAYLDEAVNVFVSNGGVLTNIVSGVNADAIKLTPGYPWYSPKEFVAHNISYTRTFDKTTSLEGAGSGWETLVLPFDVQKVTHADKGELKPFISNWHSSNAKPYWLCTAGISCWEETSEILANVPYILAMPQNNWYSEEYNMGGVITFSSIDAIVAATTKNPTIPYFKGGDIVATYETVPKGSDVLLPNETSYDFRGVDYQPGGIFIPGERDAQPFECFIHSISGTPQRILDNVTTGISEVKGTTLTRIWTESGNLCVTSGIGMNLPLNTIDGKMVMTISVKAGETVRISSLSRGIYILGNVKILL